MRRAIVALVVAVTACAQPERPNGDAMPRDATLNDFVGTWQGTIMPEGSDSVVAHIELLATTRDDGWSFTVENAANPAQSTTTPARVASVGGDSVVVMAGPFASVLRDNEPVSTHTIYRLQNGRLVGVMHATYERTGEMIMLRSEATRRP
jgi:hypothetical protein